MIVTPSATTINMTRRSSSRNEYRQYAGLVRDLEIRSALDTSQLAALLPGTGEAGPSDWQRDGEGELSPSVTPRATTPVRTTRRSRDTRWPAPHHKLQDTLFNVPNYLHEALEAYATSRIYLKGLTYPVETDVDIETLLSSTLPPGVEAEVVQMINTTLSDLAALRPAMYKNERASQEDLPWETVLHVAGPHCPQNVLKRVIARLGTETGQLSIPQHRLDVLASSAVPCPDLDDLLAPVLPGLFDKREKVQSSGRKRLKRDANSQGDA